VGEKKTVVDKVGVCTLSLPSLFPLSFLLSLLLVGLLKRLSFPRSHSRRSYFASYSSVVAGVCLFFSSLGWEWCLFWLFFISCWYYCFFLRRGERKEKKQNADDAL
jgi:Ca2+/Na+ antiporter